MTPVRTRYFANMLRHSESPEPFGLLRKSRAKQGIFPLGASVSGDDQHVLNSTVDGLDLARRDDGKLNRAGTSGSYLV